jgi:hypothetical protein
MTYVLSLSCGVGYVLTIALGDSWPGLGVPRSC